MPGRGRGTADVLAPMAAIAVGVPDEAARALHPGREARLADPAADAAGAVIAAMLLAAARGRDPSGPGLALRPR